MSENKNQLPAGTVWEVGLRAQEVEAGQLVLASFFVRLAAADMPLAPETAQDEVHRYLISSPRTYGGGSESSKTLMELFDIPINYVLEAPSELELPADHPVVVGAHQPVELRTWRVVDLPTNNN